MHAVQCTLAAHIHRGERETETLFSAHRTFNKGNMIYKNKLLFCPSHDVSTKQWLATKTSQMKGAFRNFKAVYVSCKK